MDGARSCFFLMALLMFALNAFGQSDSGPARKSSSAPLLVLTTGDLLEYPFEARSDGYEVELPGGLQFVESSRVLCVTNSRIDAWRELRGTYQSLTPDIHVRLARWCIKYQLADAAERELLDALHLDPNRQDARQLLQQVTSRRLSHVISNKERDAASQIPGAPGIAALPEARSLGGLSADNARSFVRRIQPLLSSRCAAAGCHGPGTRSEFRFTSVRSGSNPLTAERNLAAVLNQVLPDDPLRSPLLLNADAVHGEMGEPAFRGRAGSQQRQLLQDWVIAAVKDLYPDSVAGELGSELQPALSPLEEQMQVRSVISAEAGTTVEPVNAELPHGRLADRVADDRRFLQQAARAVASDPFSPEKFNRRFNSLSPQPNQDEQDSGKGLSVPP